MSFCKICYQKTSKCFCEPSWKTFESELYDGCRLVESSMESTPLRISTITVCFKLGTELNLGEILSAFEKKGSFRHIFFKKGTKKSKNEELNNAFYNQCTIKMAIRDKVSLFGESLSNVSLMLFPNGSGKAVGCRTIRTCARVIKDVVSLLMANEAVMKEPTKLCVQDVGVKMINSDFRVQRGIKQRKLTQILTDNYSVSEGGRVRSALFDPDKYPGINVKYLSENFDGDWIKNVKYTRKGRKRVNGEVSLFVFRSGSIIITGGRKPEEFKKAYTFINDVIEKHKEEVLC